MANTVAQIAHPTTDSLELSNSRSFLDHLDKDSLSLYPGRDDWRRRVCYTMLVWGARETSLDVMQFCIQYKIPYTTLKEWEAVSPEIREAYHDMKLMIACHRRVGSMTKKLDGAYAYRDIHNLDSKQHDVNRYHHDMKVMEADKNTIFNVHLPHPAVTSMEEMKKEQQNV